MAVAHGRFAARAPLLAAMRLAPGISYASIDGVTVVLDLNRDRYLRLGRDAAIALDALAAGIEQGEGHARGIPALLSSGIIARNDGGAIAPACLKRPGDSALEVAVSGAKDVGLAEIAFTSFRVRRLLSRKGLAATVEFIRRGRRRSDLCDDEPRAVGLAQRYAAVRRMLPGKPACLADAFTVSMLLTRRGVLHDVGFGVSLAPFAAHAWAQTDRHILSDRADPVRAFSPVFRL